MDPNFASAHFNLSVAYQDMGKYGDGAGLLSKRSPVRATTLLRHRAAVPRGGTLRRALRIWAGRRLASRSVSHRLTSSCRALPNVRRFPWACTGRKGRPHLEALFRRAWHAAPTFDLHSLEPTSIDSIRRSRGRIAEHRAALKGIPANSHLGHEKREKQRASKRTRLARRWGFPKNRAELC